jgi:hypothetical protein
VPGAQGPPGPLNPNVQTGDTNTAVGLGALQPNPFGGFNTAMGSSALATSVGDHNSAFGYQALRNNANGAANTAMGRWALFTNTNGTANTALGSQALFLNTTGGLNTATGNNALANNTTGGGNTAHGGSALILNTTGAGNVAIGVNALFSNSTGSRNVAVGLGAGFEQTTGSDNIYLAHPGVAGESSTIHIGSSGTHSRTFVAGVRGVTTLIPNAVSVLIDGAGQLGTVSSSRRYKEDIADMAEASRGLLRLRPVTFRYKTPYADGSKPREYGLIAEEVAEVLPDLVVYSETGQAETVQYHELNVLLVNELQRQERRLQEQAAENAALRARLDRLERAHPSRNER